MKKSSKGYNIHVYRCNFIAGFRQKKQSKSIADNRLFHRIILIGVSTKCSLEPVKVVNENTAGYVIDETSYANIRNAVIHLSNLSLVNKVDWDSLSRKYFWEGQECEFIEIYNNILGVKP